MCGRGPVIFATMIESAPTGMRQVIVAARHALIEHESGPTGKRLRCHEDCSLTFPLLGERFADRSPRPMDVTTNNYADLRVLPVVTGGR
jgi:hypothetical protein